MIPFPFNPIGILRAHSTAITLGVSLSLAALVLGAAPARASFPGYNGKIVYQSNASGNNDIYTMNPDGTGQTNLTTNAASDAGPAWSPDGTKIVFVSDRTSGVNDIWSMNANGANLTDLTQTPSNNEYDPTFSPDGTKIAYKYLVGSSFFLRVMNADGTNQTQVSSIASYGPLHWSPTGATIAFASNQSGNYEIWTVKSDGTNQTKLTSNAVTDFSPDWSPDGSKIVYCSNGDLWVMNADGGDKTQLTSSADEEEEPSWSPDGTLIFFHAQRSGAWEFDVMHADGTHLTRVGAAGPTGDGWNSWQRILNKAPVATNDSLTVPFNTLGNSSVLANDTDEQALSGGNLTISIQPSHGAATVGAATGQIIYAPTTGYAGTDQLTYHICDAFILDQKCATAVLGITVQAPVPTPTPIPTTAPAPTVSLTSIGTLKTVAGETTYYYTGHRPMFAGTATAGATVTVEIHSNPIILTTMAGSDGSWSVTPDQDLPNGDHTVTITASKDGVSTTLASYTLGINTGLAETGTPLWPLPLAGLLTLIGVRQYVRRRVA